MKKNNNEYENFIKKMEKMLDYHVLQLGNTFKVDLFNNSLERYLSTQYIKFLLNFEKYNGGIESALFVVGFNNKGEKSFEKRLYCGRNKLTLLKNDNVNKDDFSVFSEAIPTDNISWNNTWNAFFDGDSKLKESNYKLYKDFLRTAFCNVDFLSEDKFDSDNYKDFSKEYCILLEEVLSTLFFQNPSKISFLPILLNKKKMQLLYPKLDKYYLDNCGGYVENSVDYLISELTKSEGSTENGYKSRSQEDIISDVVSSINFYFSERQEIGILRNFLCLLIKNTGAINDSALQITVREDENPAIFEILKLLTETKSEDLVLFTLSDDAETPVKISDIKRIFVLE